MALNIIGVFILSFCLTATGLCAKELYTWTDGKGILHITDRPPPKNATTIHVTRYKPAATPAGKDDEVTDQEPSEESPEDQEGQEEEALTYGIVVKAKEEALEARAKAADAARKEKELLDRLGRNKKMRSRNQYKLRKAAEYTKTAQAAARSAEARAQEAEGGAEN